MRRLALVLFALALCLVTVRDGRAAEYPLFAKERFALGFTGAYAWRASDENPTGAFRRGFEFSLPLTWSVVEPPSNPDGSKQPGLHLSVFVAPLFGTSAKLTESYTGGKVGATLLLWDGGAK